MEIKIEIVNCDGMEMSSEVYDIASAEDSDGIGDALRDAVIGGVWDIGDTIRVLAA